MGKKKPAGHYCRICGCRRANEKFGGRGHALHICKDCQRDLKREARQKRKARETDVVVLEPEEDLMGMDEDDLELMLDQPLTTPSAKGTGKKGIPYHELDANIVRLVQALNRYPGVMTVGSCGGHETITNPSQWQAGT